MKTKLTFSEAGKLGALAAAKTIADLKQKRIDNWNVNPKLCKLCNKPINYEDRLNDFCNHSCSTNYYHVQRGFVLLENKVNICIHCKSEYLTKGSEAKYCSRTCMFSFHWQETKDNLLKDGYDKSSGHKVAKKYLIELHNGKCQICNLDSWNNKPMPLVLDHIDGNSDNNHLTNLRVICNNCDALTDHYKGKNIGNGRAKRRQRYKEGKSY